VRQVSIAKYHPISRSFFKLWEIIHDFQLLKEDYNTTVLCLAEGPGGFIECVLKFRKGYSDNIWGITLKSKSRDIPDWKKSYKFLKSNHINISYGSDGTGNLYNVDNILHLQKQIGKKAELITGDGGFDFSNNFNSQEQLSYRIIYSQIVASLSIQKIGGSFVLKIFDINTKDTIRMLYILYYYYEELYITKPVTSRPANSEKYIVCKKFKGIEDFMLKLFQKNLRHWEDNFVSFISLPKWFENLVQAYNQCFIKKQIENIEKTLTIIETEYKHDQSKQIKLATNWCKKYNIQTN
jgi:23S rRNA U2552 (ribose-2'-O)-methylase RlmE/FtsJ